MVAVLSEIAGRNERKARASWQMPGWRRGQGKIRTCRCMISFAMDSMGAADGTCVGVGLVGEGSSAASLRVSEK